MKVGGGLPQTEYILCNINNFLDNISFSFTSSVKLGTITIVSKKKLFPLPYVNFFICFTFFEIAFYQANVTMHNIV